MHVSIVQRFRQLLTPAWCQGFLKPPSQRCLAFLFAHSKTGNKVAANHQAQQRPFSGWPNGIPRSCKISLRKGVRGVKSCNTCQKSQKGASWTAKKVYLLLDLTVAPVLTKGLAAPRVVEAQLFCQSQGRFKIQDFQIGQRAKGGVVGHKQATANLPNRGQMHGVG